MKSWALAGLLLLSTICRAQVPFALAITNANGVRVSMVGGESNAVYQVQDSPDLVHWDDVSRLNGNYDVSVVESAPSKPKRFFRAYYLGPLWLSPNVTTGAPDRSPTCLSPLRRRMPGVLGHGSLKWLAWLDSHQQPAD